MGILACKISQVQALLIHDACKKKKKKRGHKDPIGISMEGSFTPTSSLSLVKGAIKQRFKHT